MIFILFTIVLLAILNLLSGVFAATEIALSSIDKTDLKISSELGNKKAKKLLITLKDPTSFFATTQIYITFIAFFSGAFAANAFTDPLTSWALSLNIPISETIANTTVFIIVTVSLTYFNLVFGELVPKHLALRNPKTFAFTTINFLNLSAIVVLPFVKFLSLSANCILKLMGVKNKDNEGETTKITRADIQTLLQSGVKQGCINKGECNRLNNVLEFESKVAKDVCMDQVHDRALPLEASLDEILEKLDHKKCSYLPVFENDRNNIIGILNINEIAQYIVSRVDLSEFNIKRFLHNPYFIAPSKKVDELYREMKENGMFMAIVTDDNRNVIGSITVENLVEEMFSESLNKEL